MASWTRGPLQALQDFSPLPHSVLPMVFLVSVVPTNFRSLTSSSDIILWWFTTFFNYLTSWGKISRGAPNREQLVIILYFFHFRIIKPAVVVFETALLADGLVGHSRLVQILLKIRIICNWLIIICVLYGLTTSMNYSRVVGDHFTQCGVFCYFFLIFYWYSVSLQ